MKGSPHGEEQGDAIVEREKPQRRRFQRKLKFGAIDRFPQNRQRLQRCRQKGRQGDKPNDADLLEALRHLLLHPHGDAEGPKHQPITDGR
ncbi:hypothetical protein HRbin17_02533 [bacterium HR17]|uniref:Uncharacterized protein n=1 Tax=Candidatus Fervidibacter japonicus TaxID=2035412 RepID=A0A2H5XFQ3_9BACT|nr:hypothetical protein HRbin17_02533 [bacterium HR17]